MSARVWLKLWLIVIASALIYSLIMTWLWMSTSSGRTFSEVFNGMMTISSILGVCALTGVALGSRNSFGKL
jgi:hypothetical protein